MKYLLAAATLTAAFVVSVSVEAQTPPTTIEAQARYLVNAPPPPVWLSPRPKRYTRRARPRAGLYDYPRYYPAQHELPPIFYGSRFGF